LGWIKNIKVREIAKRIVDKLSIKTPSLNQKVKNLSGGNQQKLVVGKWLAKDTGILLFDEPTRGIDVGAKSEIYRLLNDLAHQGKSIIMISSELPEILRISHRVVDYGEATQESIMQLATLRNGGNVSNN
jgi:ribose transport system ATP-binding protein